MISKKNFIFDLESQNFQVPSLKAKLKGSHVIGKKSFYALKMFNHAHKINILNINIFLQQNHSNAVL